MIKPFRGSLLNKSHPLASGLVGCWLFNEGVGKKVYDLSGNQGHITTFYNQTAWAVGKFGFCLIFDGTGDWAGGTWLGVSKPYTVLMRFYPLRTGAMESLFSPTVGPYPSFHFWSNQRMLWYAGGEKYIYSKPISINEWHCAVVTVQGASTATWFMYVDGILNEWAKGADTGDSYDPVSTIRIGGNQTSRPFLGKIGQIMVWNRILTPGEIAYVTREPFAMFRPLYNVALFSVPVVGNPYPVSRLIKNRIHGYNCFIDAYVRAKRGGFDPLKLPDGTVF